MTNSKKLIATMLAVLMTFTFTACGDDDSSSSKNSSSSGDITTVDNDSTNTIGGSESNVVTDEEGNIVTQDPSITEDPSVSKDPSATQDPSATEDPSVSKDPSVTQDPSVTTKSKIAQITIDMSDLKKDPVEPFQWTENDGKLTLKKYVGSETDVVIPAEVGGKPVVAIGDSAFFMTSVVSITVPNSVTNIERWAFSMCFKLETLTIPESVKTIGDGIIMSDKALKTVTYPSWVTDTDKDRFTKL